MTCATPKPTVVRRAFYVIVHQMSYNLGSTTELFGLMVVGLMATALVGLLVVGLKAVALVGLMVVGLKAAALVGLMAVGRQCCRHWVQDTLLSCC